MPPVMRKRNTVRPSTSNRCVLITSSPNWRCSAAIWSGDRTRPSCITTSLLAKRVSLNGGMPLGSGPRPGGGTTLIGGRPALPAPALCPPPFWPEGPPAVPGVLSLALTISSGFFSVNVSLTNCAAMLSSGESCGMFV